MSDTRIIWSAGTRSWTHALMSVATKPGDMEVAVTPCFDSAMMIDSQSDIKAALLALSAARSGSADTPAMEASATIFDPRSSSSAAVARNKGNSR